MLADGRLLDFEPDNTEWRRLRRGLRRRHDDAGRRAAGRQLRPRPGRRLAAESANPLRRRRALPHPPRPHGPDGLRQLQAAIARGRRRNDRRALPGRRASPASASTNSPSPATRRCSNCSAASTPARLGEVPFVPAAGRSLLLPAAELGLDIHPRGRAYVLPVIGGFVGGDTVAGVLATGLTDAASRRCWSTSAPTARSCLRPRGKLWAASTAAGPAFEGARIPHGMRGTAGAIEKVVVDGPPADQRHRRRPAGRPVRLGADRRRRRVAPPRHAHAARPAARARSTSRRRARPIWPGGSSPTRGRPAFLLAGEDETAHGRPILLTQRDFRELQLAAGAIRAGIALLLQRARAAAAGPGPRASSPAASAISSAAATPSGSACCPAGSSTGGFATRATRRWPGRGWRPSPAGPGAGRRARPPHRARRSLARRRFHAAFAEAMIFPADDVHQQASLGAKKYGSYTCSTPLHLLGDGLRAPRKTKDF